MLSFELQFLLQNLPSFSYKFIVTTCLNSPSEKQRL